MGRIHNYTLTINWTGNKGSGTSDYRTYERSHTISVNGKADINGSSDPAFRGDITKHNPEELLLASISVCHMLWYLHLCADAGVIVTNYSDNPTGTMEEIESGGGRFTEVTLNPLVTIIDSLLVDKANALHQRATELCFITNSVNFPVYHKTVCKVKENL